MSDVAAYDLDSGEQIDLLRGRTPWFAPTGHLVFWQEGSLWAVRFDPDRLEVEGAPVVVVQGVANAGVGGAGSFSVADNGTLVYRPTGKRAVHTLGWVDRNGEMTTALFEGEGLVSPALSPDGNSLAFVRSTESGFGGLGDVWIRDLANGREGVPAPSSRRPTSSAHLVFQL